MPIYEYRCNSCGKKFSQLVLTPSQQQEVKCPHCGSADVKRLLSAFGSLGASSGPSCTSFG